MTKKQEIKLFEDKKVRTVWDDEQEKWFFCVVDVVEALTDSKDPKDYIKKMKKRDPELSKGWGQIVTPLSVQTAGGKQKVNCAAREGIFRIIQAIPSPKAEPFKQWMAQVASQRIDQMQDPELSINQAIVDYKRLGYSDRWINQRIKSIEVRKELTDEWKRTGVKEGQEYALLTDIITQEWSGFTTKQYKHHKGLKKENLREDDIAVQDGQWYFSLHYSVYGYSVDVVNMLEALCKEGIGVVCDETARLLRIANETDYVGITPAPNKYSHNEEIGNEISLPYVDEYISPQQVAEVIAATEWKPQTKIKPITD